MTTLFVIVIVGLVALIIWGNSSTKNEEKITDIEWQEKTDKLNALTFSFNRAVADLKSKYNEAISKKDALIGATRNEYSLKYDELATEYANKRKEIETNWSLNHPIWEKSRSRWGRIIITGFLGCMAGCVGDFSMADESETETTTVSTAMENTETRYWNAETIPMPHLKDSMQYVSNPDHVLVQATVDSMNNILYDLDKTLDIESAVIVVNHIENDDPFRMAQDVGNKYGVGKNDRGLIVVMAYLDRSINISTGKALEADLTDAECKRLQADYFIPAMKVNKPDSAMLNLTRAIYAKMEQKEMPQISPLLTSQENSDFPWSPLLYPFILLGWGLFYRKKNKVYHWIDNKRYTTLTTNPFVLHPRGGGSSFGGSSSGGGGSFGGGGSYGGGSFGGGGATSRW